MKRQKRRCVYCATYFTTITGRLSCIQCSQKSNEERDRIFNERVEFLRSEEKDKK
ncbi:MAG: hypothetical protein K0S93_97 [Nitrososphaeraceae archaeon]|jgi:hypothetical protein|nr:hypothetical protein [Nitrososphaeraceae archaeon]